MSAPAAHSTKLERSIQWGLIGIVALMPVHAFFSVWLGSLTGQQMMIQAWKEIVLALLLLATCVLAWRERSRLERLRQPWVIAIGLFVFIGLVVSLMAEPSLKALVYGFKTNAEFLIAALIATMVASRQLIERLIVAVLIGASIVATFGVLQVTVLPADFLTHFGYGPDTIVPYQKIAAGTDVLRFPSTLGGPNQLGTYIILPLCLSVILAFTKRKRWLLLLSIALLICLVSAHSRSAWVGAILALILAIFYTVAPRLRRKLVIVTLVLGALVLTAIPLAIQHNSLQYFLLHSSVEDLDEPHLSNGQHATSLVDGVSATLEQPLGHGVGTAGPATFQTDTPNIIENYYLQISYETGIIGLIAFMAIVLLLLNQLARPSPAEPLGIATIGALVGISAVCLLLPAWTDSSTALIVWICAGAAVGWKRAQAHV